MAEINKDYISQSLVNQIASLSMQLAQRDAIITEQQHEIEALKKAQISEMNGEANDERRNNA